MSIKAMTAVWEDSQASGNDLVLLLAIADCANDEGTNAFPAQDTLAAKARMSVRTVQRSIASLKDAGELRIDRESTRETNVYTVVVAWNRSIAAATKGGRRQLDGSEQPDAKTQPHSGQKPEVLTTAPPTDDKLTCVTRQDSAEAETRQLDGGKCDTHVRSVVSDTPSGGVPDPSLIRSLSRPRARDVNLSRVRNGGTLIGRGESVQWQQQMDRHHAKCHPEICNWRDHAIPQCMPLALVDEFARKVQHLKQPEALAYVIGFAVNDRPPEGYVLPGTIYKHWADRWDVKHGSVSRDAKSHTPAARVVPDASETERLINEMSGGRFPL